ncbi:glycine--tRNA ligase subunit beta [Corallincola luteus]|uniref:Glycine--tRNA ligase beta subunit n=1 Tax=Corallincola luteus TaxID=1775177 RepID=A0ABY2AMZ7_9GAMM|nr:glycine--tRNA ligase subunit beta [Corallincola luteus]TCI02738.1 glycine--tRNA ligase subunit beta [Corallincola luteus]
MSTQTLLVEIGTEELPPKSLSKLASAFADSVQAGLDKAELSYTAVNWLASPRRLAVKVEALAPAQADKVVEKRGPSLKAAFDADGNATKAAEGWARGNGITVAQAERLETDKGAWLLHKAEVKGKEVDALIPDIVVDALGKLPIPKPMRWGSSDASFIRPVHTITLLYGDQLIDATILGIQSNRILQGHRFHGAATVTLEHVDDYEAVLEEQGFVIADFQRRKAMIKSQVEAVAAQEGGVADIDDALLDEVTGLVEWPVTLVGSFEDKFLEVPAEALIYTMKDNQKYFPVLTTEGELLNRFIFVSNIASKQPEAVIEGNEKVVRPRLADAEFFYKTDLKKSLESRLDSLSTVLFQKQLGTLKEKSERIASLSGAIAQQINADSSLATRAGLLSKTDLMSEMVMEFPDVQGVMGMYYARHDKEDEAVAIALNEQYMPRYAGDSLPTGDIGCAVAIADKLDTLVGIFGIGQSPKGDKDPFALRRAALGLLRIIVDKALPLDIIELAETAKAQFGDKLTNDNVVNDVFEFVLGRFRAWYQDQGYSVDIIQAVLARKPSRPADFDARIKAVAAFRSLPQAAALAAANKRVGNILAKQEAPVAETIDVTLLIEEQEKALANSVAHQQQQLAPLFANNDYQTALQQLASLQPDVDAFFDSVMVMADDLAVRGNRLALLNQLRQMFLQVADISLLQS